MQKLNYRFGDDGIFWMSFDDMLRNFSNLQRTRLFDKGWTVTQQWTSVNVSWVTGYLNTKFSVEIKKPGPVVFVLSQVRQLIFSPPCSYLHLTSLHPVARHAVLHRPRRPIRLRPELHSTGRRRPCWRTHHPRKRIRLWQRQVCQRRSPTRTRPIRGATEDPSLQNP
jgi:hypothetical protein